jgi:hypothetical protein
VKVLGVFCKRECCNLFMFAFLNSDKQRLGNLTNSYMFFRLWSSLIQMFKFVPIQCVENEPAGQMS